MNRPNRVIFITGFPGFIAGRLVERLASDGVFFYLLVQPAFINIAMQSIEKISEATGLDLGNFAIVEGDITKPGLAIDAEDLTTIREEMIVVYRKGS